MSLRKHTLSKKMNGLLYLTTEEFKVGKGTKGPILCNTIRGYSLVLFYSTSCKYCHTLIPIFTELSAKLNGCKFGMLNVGINAQLIQMAKQTITPIQYVPYVVLYNNGRPFIEYKGAHTFESINNFVIDVCNQFKNKQQFANENIKHDGKAIPKYCLGIPLCGPDDKVCYLTQEEAYPAQQQPPYHAQQQQQRRY